MHYHWSATTQLVCWSERSFVPPAVEEIGRVEDQTEVQRNDLQRRVLHFLIGPAHEIAQHHQVVSKIARIKRRVQDATIGKAAVEDDGADVEIPQQKIKIGRIKRRQPLLGVYRQVLRLDAGYELGPARSLDSMLVCVWGCYPRKVGRPAATPLSDR